MTSAATRLAAGLILALAAATGVRAACSDPPGPQVDWHGCDLQSRGLRGLDLSGANLRGADLRDADLGAANLTGADLSDADLSHSNLSRTIWTDGRVCAIASDGVCD